MNDLRLVIFDVDGTLVDSQSEIMAAMEIAYDGEAVPVPSREMVLSIVGLSLKEAFTVLSPDCNVSSLVARYKDAFNGLRGPDGKGGESPLFSGAKDMLLALHALENTLLAVATGKSKRGLDKMIEKHGLEGLFVSQQVADFHPSKPHPAMVQAALSDAGVLPARAVMIGDTSYDIDMGRAAGVATIAVNWGYHTAADLKADRIVTAFSDIPSAIDALTGEA